MRLLMTVPHFWPYVRRGSERLVHDLSAEMARRGHDVRVVTSVPAGPAWTERRDGFEVRYERVPWLLRRRGWSHLEAFAATAAVAALRHDADVLTSSFHSDAMALGRVAAVRRRPFVLSFHGTPNRQAWVGRPRLHRCLLDALRRADVVTVLSDYARRRMAEEYSVEARVVMPGIYCAGFDVEPPAARTRTVVCAASLSEPGKRIDLLLDAFERVATCDCDAALLLVGPGDPTEVLRRRARMDPRVARRVRHRPTATAELPAVYAGCAVGALCSEREAYGLVVLEYLAAGMPVVATADGGIPELTRGDGVAHLFPPGDVEACASAMRAALDAAAEPGVAARCRAHAARWDWRVRGDDYADLYHEVAA